MSGTRWSTHAGGRTSAQPAPPAGALSTAPHVSPTPRRGRANAPRNDATRGAALLAGTLLSGLLTLVLVRRVVVLAGGVAARPAATGPDDLVELGVLAAGVLVLAWLSTSCAVTAGCLLARGAGRGWRRGEAWVHRFAPALLRRALVVSVVAGLGISAATGATAAARNGTDPASVVVVTATVDPAPPVDLGWVVTPTPAPTPGATTPSADAPAAAIGATPTATSVPTAPPTTPARVGADGDGLGTSPAATPDEVPVGGDPGTAATVVVTHGDTLWGIAARHLGAHPSDAAIAAAWPAWYDANAATIGADPGLIRPGQVLRVPAAAGPVALS